MLDPKLLRTLLLAARMTLRGLCRCGATDLDPTLHQITCQYRVEYNGLTANNEAGVPDAPGAAQRTREQKLEILCDIESRISALTDAKARLTAAGLTAKASAVQTMITALNADADALVGGV